MLILPIKKKWFDMIASGKKKHEYRDIKPYYNSRLKDKLFEEVVFRNGYRKDSPKIKCMCIIRKGQGYEEWGAEKRKRILYFRNFGGRKMSRLEDFEDLPYEDELKYTERQMNKKLRDVVDICNKKQNDTYEQNKELKKKNKNLKIMVKILVEMMQEEE